MFTYCGKPIKLITAGSKFFWATAEGLKQFDSIAEAVKFIRVRIWMETKCLGRLSRDEW